MPALWAQVNVLTWHNDAARTGQNLQESILTRSDVNSTTFGLLFTVPADGKVDAQPLYAAALNFSGVMHNVVFVATENDTVYAYDADGGAQLWSHSVLGSGETASDARGCSQVVPQIGITSTPVIDLTSGTDGTIFLVAMTKDGSGNYHQRLHALDLITGAEESGWPVEVTATYPSSGGMVTFAPGQYKERAALLLSNGIIYTTWASHCDIQPYNSWVIGYNESTRAQVVLNLTPNGSQGAIWQSGAGPAADAGGDLYALLGNGTFDTTLNANGFPASGDYGNAFVNLSTTAGVAVRDYFTMDNTVTESNNDEDLGSGGAMLLPTLNDAMAQPHNLAVGAGKDGNAYVVDRNNMGKFNMSSNAVYQEFALGGAVYSSPAWFNNTLYYGPVGQQISAYPYSGGSFQAASAQTSVSSGFVYPGTTPSISADGSANGIVWAMETGSNAILYAFNSDNLTKLYDSTQAPGSRDQFGAGITFATPTVANGKVFVGTTTGVGVFGLLGCTYSLFPNSVGYSAAGSSGTFNVTATAGCPWSVVNNSNFIAVTAGASGTGNGTFSISVPANPGVARTGYLTVAGQTFTVTEGGDTTTSGLGFFPLTPCRVADTRASGGSGLDGAFGPPSMAAASARNFPIPNSFCQAPSTAQAYSLNITVAPPGPLAYLTTWPDGQSQPVVSTLNDETGTILANAAIVPAGTDSSTNIFVNNATDVIMDMNGYFASPNSPQALAFYPVTPCRVADTRNADGPFGGPEMSAQQTRSFPVPSSSCGIPGSAQAYSLNMTVVPPGYLAYLTVWPDGESQPLVSTLNDLNGDIVAN
ncbi:MAG: PQQ-binding-like beta-propeller repeat protein, partial [Bryobacterales bacterium]|nr:PQQ-binding-like beta-propeller repeat protein [Bryobacterales bacterium]